MIQVPKGLKGKELFKWLVAHKSELIEAKKSANKFTDVIELAPTWIKDTGAVKGKYLFEDNVDAGTLKRTIIANTYNWMDSHSDVHLDNVFANSIAQRPNNPAPHLVDHNFSMLAKVGKPIGYKEQDISWRELGQGKTGMTMALMLESEILKSYNERIFNDYLDGQVNQHSVSMRYINLSLAVNDGESYPNEFKVWQDVIGKLGNRKTAEEQGYFWAIKEAALIETSAVLAGSNELTPTMGKSAAINMEQALKDLENGTISVKEYNKKLEEYLKTEPLEDIPPLKPRKALDVNKVLKGFLN